MSVEPGYMHLNYVSHAMVHSCFVKFEHRECLDSGKCVCDCGVGDLCVFGVYPAV